MMTLWKNQSSTTVVYRIEDVGSPKRSPRKHGAHNPNILIQPYSTCLTEENILEIFDQYDVILDGSDNFETRYLVNDACVIFGKPLVFGAIYKFSGQPSVFNFKNGPTYCLFPEPPGVDALPPVQMLECLECCLELLVHCRHLRLSKLLPVLER